MSTGIKISLLLIVILWGCATPAKKTSSTAYPHPEKKLATGEGVYHRVKKGETLWRISKSYGVALESIVAANRLADATKISAGQSIFIPKATALPRAISETKEKGFIWPARGKVISYFGVKRPDATINKGIDILAKESSDVVAARSGKVVFCSDKIKGLGKTVIIEHEDQLYSVYSNNAVLFVKPEQRIQQGELIAQAGRNEKTGEYVLHFEIRRGHIPQNPFYFLP